MKGKVSFSQLYYYGKKPSPILLKHATEMSKSVKLYYKQTIYISLSLVDFTNFCCGQTQALLFVSLRKICRPNFDTIGGENAGGYKLLGTGNSSHKANHKNLLFQLKGKYRILSRMTVMFSKCNSNDDDKSNTHSQIQPTKAVLVVMDVQ